MDDFDDSDTRPIWCCVICTKYMGKQGSGADFELDFGYPSSFDEGGRACASKIVGWICDECVVVHKERFMVCTTTKPEQPPCFCPAASEYDDPCPRHGVVAIGRIGVDEPVRCTYTYTPLADHDKTRINVTKLDFAGREPVELHGVTRDVHGIIERHTFTSADRIEALRLLEAGDHLPRALGLRLLAGLYEIEAAAVKEQHQALIAHQCLIERMQQQAELLGVEDLKRLRETEQSLYSNEDVARLWESVERYGQMNIALNDLWQDVNDVLQIRDDVADGHPVIRGTTLPLSEFLKYTTVNVLFNADNFVRAVPDHSGLRKEQIKPVFDALAKFFDASFMDLMIYSAEHGAVHRYLASLTEARKAP